MKVKERWNRGRNKLQLFFGQEAELPNLLSIHPSIVCDGNLGQVNLPARLWTWLPCGKKPGDPQRGQADKRRTCRLLAESPEPEFEPRPFFL